MEGFLGIGGNELVIILIFAFLIFGPDKLPQIARTLGRAIARFRDAQNEVTQVIRSEVAESAAKQDPNAANAAQDNSSFTDGAQARTESFAERKARYDKIRAERQAREREARQQKIREVAASKASASAQDAEGNAAAAVVTAAAAAATTEAAQPAVSEAPATPASATTAAAGASSAGASAPAPNDQELDMLFGFTGTASPSTATQTDVAAEKGGDA
jgi:TatA/E family protein of Tat protein translocase